jgi:hypothetical protein
MLRMDLVNNLLQAVAKFNSLPKEVQINSRLLVGLIKVIRVKVIRTKVVRLVIAKVKEVKLVMAKANNLGAIQDKVGNKVVLTKMDLMKFNKVVVALKIKA